jgi:hypothetical protein
MTRLKATAAAFLATATMELAGANFAQAMDIRVQGTTVTMSGPVTGNECRALKEILDTQWIREVVLTGSLGGNVDAGYCVGELIRARGVNTRIDGYCISSCSRMWLGGVERTLEGFGSRVGLHGHYDNSGNLIPGAPERLRAWIPRFTPVDTALMEKWINLPRANNVMFFYGGFAENCTSGTGGDVGRCSRISGMSARAAGLTPIPITTESKAPGSAPSPHEARKAIYPPSGFARLDEWTKLPIAKAYLPNYFTYLNETAPKALAFSADKQTGAWSGSRDQNVDVIASALRRCKERAGSDCALYAIDNEVVFKP